MTDLEDIENNIELGMTFPDCPIMLDIDANKIYNPIKLNPNIEEIFIIYNKQNCKYCKSKNKMVNFITKIKNCSISIFNIIQIITENSIWFENNICHHQILTNLHVTSDNIIYLIFTDSL